MKYLFWIFILTLFIPTNIYSQIEIKGIVRDSLNTIEFANVILLNQNNEIVAGTITDKEGVFSLSKRKGNYKLTISFIGYDDWVNEVVLDKNLNIGVVTLVESKNQLDEIILTAKRPTDRKKGRSISF